MSPCIDRPGPFLTDFLQEEEFFQPGELRRGVIRQPIFRRHDRDAAVDLITRVTRDDDRQTGHSLSRGDLQGIFKIREIGIKPG